jgi:hypothetical protein
MTLANPDETRHFGVGSVEMIAYMCSVRLKIRNGKWEAVKWDECGSHVVGCFV